MTRHSTTLTLIIVRLFVACTTFLLLTSAVMHRQDHDGYQATHLFFMPRENWEMDKGRGMLYEEEHYVSFETGELNERDLTGYEHEYGYDERERIEVSSSPLEHGDTLGPTISRIPHSPDLSGSQLPVLYAVETLILGVHCSFGDEEQTPLVHLWRGSTPTPPPRPTA